MTVVAPAAGGEVIEVGPDPFGAVERDGHDGTLRPRRRQLTEAGLDGAVDVPLAGEPADVGGAG